MNYVIFFSIPVLIYFLNSYFVKNKSFLNFSGEKHQKILGKKNIPLTGGVFLIIFLSAILFEKNMILYLFLVFIFLIGLFSDIKVLAIPSRRLVLQSMLITSFVYLFDINIMSTRIIILDQLLINYYFFSIFFTSLCLVILVNGTNFIDGLNSLVLTYYLIILALLYKLNLLTGINFTDFQSIYLIYLLFVLIIFNFFNKLYLGDSGAYLLGFLFGYLLIEIHNKHQDISPYFIALLLWYPCFENLFSIIRKFNLGRSPVSPDSKHFHQLLFYFLKNKYKLNNFFCNNFSSIIINFYNFVILLFGSLDFYNTQFLITLIMINILIYTFAYLKLFRFKYKILRSNKK